MEIDKKSIRKWLNLTLTEFFPRKKKNTKTSYKSKSEKIHKMKRNQNFRKQK